MLFTTFFTALKNQAWDKLLPCICIICSARSGNRNLCASCLKSLPILSQNCSQCAQTLHGITGVLCGACLKDPPPFDRTLALFPYEPPIGQLIVRLKFQQKLSYARAFAELLIEAIRHRWYVDTSLPDFILPVPLHNQRLQKRGFNQAVEIARPLARTFNLPLDLSSTQRHRETQAQSGLLAAERKQNIAQAFSSNADFSGQHIAVLDDVITTGHTIREFCTLLKKHGARQIDVWCCARRC